MSLDAQPIEIVNMNIRAILGVVVHDGAKLAVLHGFADLRSRTVGRSLKPTSLL